MPVRPDPPEIVLSAAWHAGLVPAKLQTTDGVSLEVVHRGTWSHGLGPDFQNALLLIDGRELRSGSIEIHLQSRGWRDHGHHLDPMYDAVILHAVGHHDGSVTRRHDGAIVPIVDIGPVKRFPQPDFAAWDWARVGGRCCAERLSTANPRALREILHRLGDVRLAARSARIEARFADLPPGEVFWSELLDGLGYSANREPMRALARAVPLNSLEDLLQATPEGIRIDVARGILLGAAGFLPLSPSEAHLGGLQPNEVASLESSWREKGQPWRLEAIPQSAWQRVRVRPANHPVPRLLTAASILTSASLEAGLLDAIIETLLAEESPVAPLRACAAGKHGPGLGEDRALDIVASIVIPFALALAAHSGEQRLADAASRQWERLPGSASNATSRRAARQIAGSAPLGKIGARGAQGLIHLDTILCQPRRCFECPIAAAELSVNG